MTKIKGFTVFQNYCDRQLMQRYLLSCGYAGSSFDVKIQTDSNDAMGIKTEDDHHVIIEHHPTTYFDMKL